LASYPFHFADNAETDTSAVRAFLSALQAHSTKLIRFPLGIGKELHGRHAGEGHGE